MSSDGRMRWRVREVSAQGDVPRPGPAASPSTPTADPGLVASSEPIAGVTGQTADQQVCSEAKQLASPSWPRPIVSDRSPHGTRGEGAAAVRRGAAARGARVDERLERVDWPSEQLPGALVVPLVEDATLRTSAL